LFSSSVLQLKSFTLLYYERESVLRLNVFFENMRVSRMIIYWRYKYVSELQISRCTK